MKDLRILVTGASGLLGSKLVEKAVEKRHTVYSCYYNHPATQGLAIKMDITDKAKVFEVMKKLEPDIIVHAAALTDVDLCERDNGLAVRVNVEGTRNILTAIKEYDPYLAYISTDYVFSGDKGQYEESDSPNPINFYGYTKLECESIVTSSDLKYVIARTSVVYGARPASGKHCGYSTGLGNVK